MTDILLLNPPFTTAREPNISIPALTAYLNDHGIRVSAFDLNREFFVRALDPEKIKIGYEFAVNRFQQLNNQSGLNFSEMIEYARIYNILKMLEKHESEITMLRMGFLDFEHIQEMDSNVKDLLIQIFSTPCYPEIITTSPVFSYSSSYSPFSSFDIIRSVHSESMFSSMLSEIIHEQVMIKRPKIIGISVIFDNQVIPAFYCASVIRRIMPDVHVTIGGAFISIHFRELKEKGIFDIVNSLIIDEGEIPLERLFRELSNPSPDLNLVPGLIYRSNDRIIFNDPVPPVDMEDLPAPDYNVFQLDRYIKKRNQMRIPFRFSRGCYWKRCAFCRTNLPMIDIYQQPSLERLYENLKQIIDNTQISRFLFSDESAKPDTLDYLAERLIEDNLKIDWFAHSRISKSLTKKRCELYAKAGCNRLALGVESFEDRILQLMNKGITAQLIEEVIAQIEGVIPVQIYMILGFPTETEEEARSGYNKVMDFKKNGLISGFYYSPFAMVYGSDIWKNPENYGIDNIHFPEKSDLLPDTYDFESSGMSRDSLARLIFEFKGKSVIDKHKKHETIKLKGKEEALNYNLIELDSILDRYIYKNAFMSFNDLLNMHSNQHIKRN